MFCNSSVTNLFLFVFTQLIFHYHQELFINLFFLKKIGIIFVTILIVKQSGLLNIDLERKAYELYEASYRKISTFKSGTSGLVAGSFRDIFGGRALFLIRI